MNGQHIPSSGHPPPSIKLRLRNNLLECDEDMREEAAAYMDKLEKTVEAQAEQLRDHAQRERMSASRGFFGRTA